MKVAALVSDRCGREVKRTAMPLDKAQPLIHVTALSTMLLDELERTSDPIASDEFIAELRDLSERVKAQLEVLHSTAG